MRILITDRTKSSQEAVENLKKMKVSFVEISVEKISPVNFKIPVLLAPEGRFEGVESVKMYLKAERNGFNKKLENPTTIL